VGVVLVIVAAAAVRGGSRIPMEADRVDSKNCGDRRIVRILRVRVYRDYCWMKMGPSRVPATLGADDA
jgi:hypothetical protein